MSSLLLLISECHAYFYISSAYAKLGLSMDTGDVNGDGLEDLLVWHANYFKKHDRFIKGKIISSIYKKF